MDGPSEQHDSADDEEEKQEDVRMHVAFVRDSMP
jgi:hypothetical protein